MRCLPVYAGDVSGACSALFELGGMCVIHDPSGCNSTYNTHDETRWYTTDSLIFITGLTEREAMLGQDERLVHDVVEAAREFSPRFIALANSPVPYLSGTDFHAICRIIERETSIRCLYVPTNGMHDYVSGAGAAFAQVARHLTKPHARLRHTANILGLTPLDFACGEGPDAVRSFVEGCGIGVLSSWAMGSSLDELVRASAAEVNLVVSATGIAAAQVLKERFGTPFVVGLPEGRLRGVLERALHEAAASGQDIWCCRDMRDTLPPAKGHYVISEPVWAASFACARALENEPVPRVIINVEAPTELLAAPDVRCPFEDDLEERLADATHVTADPLISKILPDRTVLHPRPHFAFSGRAALRFERDARRSDASDKVL